MMLRWYCHTCGYFNFGSGNTSQPPTKVPWKDTERRDYYWREYTFREYPDGLLGECFEYHLPMIELEV